MQLFQKTEERALPHSEYWELLSMCFVYFTCTLPALTRIASQPFPPLPCMAQVLATSTGSRLLSAKDKILLVRNSGVGRFNVATDRERTRPSAGGSCYCYWEEQPAPFQYWSSNSSPSTPSLAAVPPSSAGLTFQ